MRTHGSEGWLYGGDVSTDWPWAEEFEPDGTYLNSATMGLPPRQTLAAVTAALDEWRRGVAHAPGYDADVAAAREAYARLVGVEPDTVAIGSQASPAHRSRRGRRAGRRGRARPAE